MDLNQAPNISNTSGSETEVKPEKKKRDWSKVNRGAKGGMPRKEFFRLNYLKNRESLLRRSNEYNARKRQEKLLAKNETAEKWEIDIYTTDIKGRNRGRSSIFANDKIRIKYPNQYPCP